MKKKANCMFLKKLHGKNPKNEGGGNYLYLNGSVFDKVGVNLFYRFLENLKKICLKNFRHKK